MPFSTEDFVLFETYYKHVVNEIAIAPRERTPEQQLDIAKQFVARFIEIRYQKMNDSQVYTHIMELVKKAPNFRSLLMVVNGTNLFGSKLTEQELLDHIKEGEQHLVTKHNPSEDEQTQLQQGIAVEKEHTDDPAVAKKIAKDHIKEKPDYYKQLKKAGL